MLQYIEQIEKMWQIRDKLAKDLDCKQKQSVNNIIEYLNQGLIRVCTKNDDIWLVNHWIKKAIILYLMINDSRIYSNGCTKWYDKVAPKFSSDIDDDILIGEGYRIAPGAFIRTGSYIGKNAIIMPSFINIGAYIGEGSMIDSWATIGSCAQIGKDCHISGGTGIGGVLEPIQNNPVIIEDNCFIGARSEIVEGVIVKEGSVISMGVFIGASTKIVYRDSGEIIYGAVPSYSVVVPGTLPAKKEGQPSLYCAVIIKQVDKKTRDKIAINDLLRS